MYRIFNFVNKVHQLLNPFVDSLVHAESLSLVYKSPNINVGGNKETFEEFSGYLQF